MHKRHKQKFRFINKFKVCIILCIKYIKLKYNMFACNSNNSKIYYPYDVFYNIIINMYVEGMFLYYFYTVYFS